MSLYIKSEYSIDDSVSCAFQALEHEVKIITLTHDLQNCTLLKYHPTDSDIQIFLAEFDNLLVQKCEERRTARIRFLNFVIKKKLEIGQ